METPFVNPMTIELVDVSITFSLPLYVRVSFPAPGIQRPFDSATRFVPIMKIVKFRSIAPKVATCASSPLAPCVNYAQHNSIWRTNTTARPVIPGG